MKNIKTQQIRALITLGVLTIAFYVGVNVTQAKPSVINATFVMQQSTINLRSYGETITCTIEFASYDVNDLKIKAVKLNDSIHVNSNVPAIIGDSNNNSIADAILEFNRTEIVDFLISKSITNGNITLTISGVVADVTFEGYDKIMVSVLSGDVNCDSIVNVNDIVEAIAGFNTEDGELNWNSNANFAPHWNKLDLHDLITIAYHYGETYP